MADDDIFKFYEPKTFKQNLDQSFEESFKDSMRKIGGISRDAKDKFKASVNDMIRRNDAEYKELQQAFINKEKNIMDLCYLIKVGTGILGSIELEDKERTERVAHILNEFPIDEINKAYDDIIYNESLGIQYNLGNKRKKLYDILNGKNNGYTKALVFVRTIFDDTEIAKETVSQAEDMMGFETEEVE